MESNKNMSIYISEQFGKVRTILNDDGSISINAEDAAIGLGWYEEKGGRKYPRWRTINGFISEIGFSQLVGKGDYIPESLFYLLGMKANNKAAQEFQKWIAVDVLPEIRRSGSYNINEDRLLSKIKALLCQDECTVEMKHRIKNLENNMTIDYSQQEELRRLAVKKVVAILGGKEAPAYRELNKKAFSSIWREYKRIMDVNSYKNTPVIKFQLARHIIIDWHPDRDLELMIKGANSQYSCCY